MGLDLGINQISERVGELADNVIDGVRGILGLSTETSKPYPVSIGNDVNFSNFTNSPTFRDGAWKASLGYEFVVVKVGTDEKILSDPAPGWQTFRLQINPQELTQDEIFAIEVTPTFRGVVVEHHGQILKDITIAGTTGLSPNRREGGAISATGRPVLAVGRSGYEEFHELRSYFRIYVESKRVDDKSNGELRLIFKNLKDNEHLFVEPQRFTMKRTNQRRTLYDYNIQLKAIGVANGPKKNDGDNYGIIGDIVDVINKASDLIELATQTIEGTVGIIKRFERDVENTILGPIRQLNTAIQAVKNGSEALLGEQGITRRFMTNLKIEIERVEANFNDGIGTDTTAFNTAVGRTPTLSGDPLRQTTFEEFQALNGFQNAKRGISLLASENALFIDSASVTNEEVESVYEDKITLPTPNSVRSITVLGGDDVQTISVRELGDPDRYREIILLNNLKPPYIDEIASDGVLGTGDKILIPQGVETGSTGVKINQEFNITRLLSEAEKNLGVDLRLDKNNDLAISNIKDLDLIAGVTNMSQAILVRLALEPGDLKRHLGIGTGLTIGRKVTTSLINEMRSNIFSSFASDLRVESIPFLETTQEGNTTIIEMVIKLKVLNQAIPIPITIINTA